MRSILNYLRWLRALRYIGDYGHYSNYDTKYFGVLFGARFANFINNSNSMMRYFQKKAEDLAYDLLQESHEVPLADSQEYIDLIKRLAHVAILGRYGVVSNNMLNGIDEIDFDFNQTYEVTTAVQNFCYLVMLLNPNEMLALIITLGDYPLESYVKRLMIQAYGKRAIKILPNEKLKNRLSDEEDEMDREEMIRLLIEQSFLRRSM